MRGFWSRKQPVTPVPEHSVAPVQRKPRILIAGEFSAGKTQLINGLVGANVLPSNVTATALPPVWLIRGEPALIRIGFSGRGEPLADLSTVDLEKTQYCALSNPAPVLTAIDIIDTPGNSDPNMAAETWQRMLTFADAVVWCTNATQAWRQSEKAVWQAMPARLRQNATLVVTHADLLGSPAMAERVLARVQREAAGFFDRFIMASLLERSDLDLIAAHLRNISGTLRLDGAANKLISDFAAAVPVRSPAPEQSAAPAVTETPVTGPTVPAATAVAQPAEPPAEAPASAAPLAQGGDPGAPSVSQRGSGATVLQMVRPRPQELPAEGVAMPSAPVTAGQTTANPGRARVLWTELSKSVDRSDPESVLAAVEHLIARLDARPAQSGGFSNVSASGSGMSGPVADVYE